EARAVEVGAVVPAIQALAILEDTVLRKAVVPAIQRKAVLVDTVVRKAVAPAIQGHAVARQALVARAVAPKTVDRRAVDADAFEKGLRRCGRTGDDERGRGQKSDQYRLLDPACAGS